MKYRFYGDKLQLIKYEISAEVNGRSEIFPVAGDEERDELVERYPDAKVTPIDNSGYEWLDGMTFTQEQLKNGELEQAIEFGQGGYEAMKAATNQEAINAMLLLQIAELKAEVKGNE